MSRVTDWIPVAAPVATVLTAALALRPAYLQYRLRIREDQRLAESARAEVDVRLVGLFTQLMAKAHARGESKVVAEAVTAILTGNGPLVPTDLSEMKEVLRACTATLPIGAAEQEAAIAAIAELGCRYSVLHRPALAGLEDIASWHEQSNAAQEALERLRADAGEPPGQAIRNLRRSTRRPRSAPSDK